MSRTWARGLGVQVGADGRRARMESVSGGQILTEHTGVLGAGDTLLTAAHHVPSLREFRHCDWAVVAWSEL